MTHVNSKSLKKEQISQPCNGIHDIYIDHIGSEDKIVDEDLLMAGISPPSPCPGSSISNASISQLSLLKEELISALRLELKNPKDEHNKQKENRHCPGCSCELMPGKSCGSIEPNKVNVKEKHFQKMNRRSKSIDTKFETDTVLQDTRQEHCGYDKNIHNNNYNEKTHRPHSTELTRANTTAAQTNHIQSPTIRRREKHNHKGRPLSKADERECMALALQYHIADLVGGIVFKDSELPDSPLADGCLTEDECACVRKKRDRKDQVRVLLSIIKGRDFDVMKRFLKRLEEHNKDIAKSIAETFEENKKIGVRCSKCALCELMSHVNLKYLVDILWGNRLIDDGLFNLITDTDKPTGAQGDLWHDVIQSLNRLCTVKQSDVRTILSTALTKNQHYNHTARGIEAMIINHQQLLCLCELRCSGIVHTASQASLTSSQSPATSESDYVED